MEMFDYDVWGTAIAGIAGFLWTVHRKPRAVPEVVIELPCQQPYRSEKQGRVLFLDFDDTIRLGISSMGRYVHNALDVHVFEGVAEILQQYKKEGWRIAGVTNQGGVAFGNIQEQALLEGLHETNRQCGYAFDVIEVCVHHPRANGRAWSSCWCRKPRPGLLIAATQKLMQMYGEVYPPYLSLMVGDRIEDEGAAAGASVPFQWAGSWRKNPSGLPSGVGLVRGGA